MEQPERDDRPSGSAEGARQSIRDREMMLRAHEAARRSRCIAPPNPWVGAVVLAADGTIFEGSTRQPGEDHAERVALALAGSAAKGSTLYVTLEPCSHTGRTPPCVEAIVAAGVARVVVAVLDPDVRVAGTGVEQLRDHGIQVDVGVEAERVEAQLRPYLHHRRTGRPYVVLKTATTLDGRTAAPDGSSQWITGPAARSDGHRLRAESDVIMVGAGTVRRDDPSLTVRDWKPTDPVGDVSLNPVRVVLGAAPEGAKVHPCIEMRGEMEDVLNELGQMGYLQVLVEGGAHVAGALHRAGLVDRYVAYIAPALFGGDDARAMFAGPGAWSIDAAWRGRIVSVDRLGDDLKIEVEPAAAASGPSEKA